MLWIVLACAGLLGCRGERSGQQSPAAGRSAPPPAAPAGATPPRKAPDYPAVPQTRPQQSGTPRPTPGRAGAVQATPRSAAAIPLTAGLTSSLDITTAQAGAFRGSASGAASNPPASQPASPPEDLDAFSGPIPGQFALYAISAGGAPVRWRQTIDAVGPGPGEVTASEQVLINNQPVGKPTPLRLPRFSRRWPAPQHTDARTVTYTRESIDLVGKSLDCIVLTIEARAAGVTRIEKDWLCPQVPLAHLVRLTVTTDGREVFRQELLDFGSTNPPGLTTTPK